MKRLFIVVTIVGLATTLVPVSVHAGRLAFDTAGNLFERGEDSIFKFTPDGKKSTFISGLSTGLGVYNLAFDAAGNLFVSDEDSHSILKFTPDGKKSTFASGLSTYGVYNLAFDAAGNLFVSDQDSHSILKFTPDGKKSTFATGFNPSGMAFDDKGNLFDSDDRGQRIIKFSPDGTQSAFASGVKGDLAFDGAGNLFVADGRSIFKFTPDGTESTFAWDVSSTSPDKKWEFVGGEEPRILDAATKQVVLENFDGRGGPVWAPDSKRFGFNYHYGGRRGYIFRSVAFYELRVDKWEELGSPADDGSGSQLVQLLKGHLPKKFDPRDCSSNSNILELRDWADASTATLYAPCYQPNSEKVKAGFLFTLKFDAAGKWKIVKTHQMSEKEIEKIEKGE
jgi:hypothetical protein